MYLKTIISTILLLICNSAIAMIIPPENHHYSYTGRIDFSSPQTPVISWPGTSIKARFTGNYLAILLNDHEGKNFFNVIIDGDDLTPYVVQAEKGKHKYVIATSLSTGEHQMEIYKRTEGEDGLTTFLGIEIADNATLLPAPPKPIRRIEFYGDSITSGLAIEAAINGNEKIGAEKNNYLTYSSIAGRDLNAEVHTISQSGIGLMHSWFDFTMFDFYDQLNADGNNNSHWDFSKWTPDVVVVNLLQNDSWIYDTLTEKPSVNAIVENYLSFIRLLREKYPNTYIICALGSMDATRPNSPWPSYITSAVKILNSQYKDEKVTTLFFKFNGYAAHPRQAQNRENAQLLEQAIRELTHWN